MSIKVLLIDDEPGVLKALSLLFRAIKIECEPVSDPRIALELLSSGRKYDAIFSDLRMPHLDGIELLTEIVKLGIKIPFFLISGHATDEEMQKAQILGATMCIKKPFGIDEIKTAISLLN